MLPNSPNTSSRNVLEMSEETKKKKQTLIWQILKNRRLEFSRQLVKLSEFLIYTYGEAKNVKIIWV